MEVCQDLSHARSRAHIALPMCFCDFYERLISRRGNIFLQCIEVKFGNRHDFLKIRIKIVYSRSRILELVYTLTGIGQHSSRN